MSTEKVSPLRDNIPEARLKPHATRESTSVWTAEVSPSVCLPDYDNVIQEWAKTIVSMADKIYNLHSARMYKHTRLMMTKLLFC